MFALSQSEKKKRKKKGPNYSKTSRVHAIVEEAFPALVSFPYQFPCPYLEVPEISTCSQQLMYK